MTPLTAAARARILRGAAARCTSPVLAAHLLARAAVLQAKAVIDSGD